MYYICYASGRSIKLNKMYIVTIKNYHGKSKSQYVDTFKTWEEAMVLVSSSQIMVTRDSIIIKYVENDTSDQTTK